MAIAVQMDFHGASIQKYDEAVEIMGMIPGSPALRHELFHWVAGTDDGFRIVDVWESSESFADFEQERLQPLCEKVGVQLPEIQVFSVHNYFARGRRT